MDKEDKMKACLSLHIIGEDMLHVYINFKFENDGDDMKLKVILKKFNQYYNPKMNQAFERHKFFTCVQKPGEKIDADI